MKFRDILCPSMRDLTVDNHWLGQRDQTCQWCINASDWFQQTGMWNKIGMGAYEAPPNAVERFRPADEPHEEEEEQPQPVISYGRQPHKFLKYRRQEAK